MQTTKLLLIGFLSLLPACTIAQGPPIQSPPFEIPPAPLPGEASVGQQLPVLPPVPGTQIQPTVPPVPLPGPVAIPQTALPPAAVQGPYQSPSIHAYPMAVPQGPYYWRVGTRGCGQTFRKGICNCELGVSGCGPDGRWRPTTMNELLRSVNSGGPICIMVHGSLVDEFGSRVDSRGTYRWLRNAAPNMPLHVIFFDWPSQRCIGPHAPVQFIQLGRQAARNGFPLARLISQLPDSPICLMGHSHGARVVCAATHLMGGGKVQGRALGNPDQRHRIRLVLAAAAIDHHWLNPGERYDRAVVRAENIVSIENRSDPALVIYPLQRPFGTTALGQKGLRQSDEEALGPLRNRIYHLNVTQAVGKRHVWPYYYDEPRIAHAVASSVFFPDIYAPAMSVQQAYPVPMQMQIGSGARINQRQR